MIQKITIKAGNNILEGFDNINVSRNMESFCATFSFNAYSEGNVLLPFSPSQSCEILVDNKVFLTGIIDRDFIGINPTSQTYSISGRDRTSLLVDNSIEGNINFNTPINIVDIIQHLVIGYKTEIFVIPPVEAVADFEKEELTAGDEGNNVFQFIEKLARQRALLLRTDEVGDIVLESKPDSKYKVKLLSEINGINNNVKECSKDRDASQRYKRYKVNSQTNLSSGINSAMDYNINAEATDEDENINPDRYLEVDAEISGNKSTNSNRAEWEKKIRAARGEIYTCVVDGFTAEVNNGISNFWNINRLIDVKIDVLGLNKTMLIKSVNYNYTNDGGEKTTLELVDKDAYIIGT